MSEAFRSTKAILETALTWGFALGAVDPVEKRGEINQLRARFQVVEVKQLLAIHDVLSEGIMAVRLVRHKSYSA